MWTAASICVNDCNIKLEGTEAYFLPPVSVNITFSSARPMALLNQFPLSVPQRLYNWHLHNLFHLLY